MKKYSFSAYALTREFNLNSIANHFGINKKIKWEEPLILTNEYFKDIVDCTYTKTMYVYSFGVIVFVDFSAGEMTAIIDFFERNFNISKNKFSYKFTDEYVIEVNPEAKLSISNHYAVVPEDSTNHIQITALILAKSSALDRLENSLSKAFDQVESIINTLKEGKLKIKNNSLSKIVSKILGFKYESISYVMLFDKPDSTWNDSSLDVFYINLFELFELTERYEKAKSKLESTLDITKSFSKLSHKNKMANLDIAVIVLILIFIVFEILSIFNK